MDTELIKILLTCLFEYEYKPTYTYYILETNLRYIYYKYVKLLVCIVVSDCYKQDLEAIQCYA